MDDPHPLYQPYGWKSCPTPDTALPGDTWVCPDCKRAYFASADYGDGDGTFRWVIDPEAEQPDLPLPED